MIITAINAKGGVGKKDRDCHRFRPTGLSSGMV